MSAPASRRRLLRQPDGVVGESAWPKPRVIVLSFPHNPTTACVDLAWMQRIVDFAREHEIVLVHDFAYADISPSTATSRPRSCRCPGPRTWPSSSTR